MRDGEGDVEQAKEAADDNTSTRSRPLPPPSTSNSSSFLPPLNLRAAALRSREEDRGCFCGITKRPASWEQSSPEERAWAAEVKAATAHLPPPARLLPREATAALLERAVGGEKDGEGSEAAALRRLKERLDDAGLKVPTVSISWQSISVSRRRGGGERERGGKEGKAALPSLVSPFFSAANDLSSALRTTLLSGGKGEEVNGEEGDKKEWLRVLEDSTGVLLPGTTTLLLGPPGSGKTTLLRALSGRLKPSRGGGVRITGAERVLYNGARAGDGCGFSVPRTVAYVSASDRHLPTLTVRETLRFAEECHGGDPTIRPLLESLVTIEERRKSESSKKSGRDAALDSLMAALCNPANSAATEWVLRVLGLSHSAADTQVGGDALHRGVSGGERRRASTGELLVGAARALCLDEISTGLDSSSTAALARSLKSSARDLGVGVLAALLAPEPDAVAAFDDVLLLSSNGKTIYHGPVEEAFAHFSSLGLIPLSEKQDVADFLLDVASPEGRRALWNKMKGSSDQTPPPPPSTAALAAAFRASEIGKRLAAAAADPFPRYPQTDAELCRGSFAAPRLSLFKSLLRRAAKVDLFSVDGASAALTRWLLALLMSLAVGSLFLNLPVSLEGGQARLAVLFFALFFVVTLAVPAIEVAHGRKPVVLRQRDDEFYPAWLDVASQAAVAVPVIAVDVLAATLPLYFLAGFSRDPRRVASFVGVFFLLELGIEALNRSLGILSDKLNWGIAVGVCALLALETTAGFTLSAESIPAGWRAMHWVNPMAWAFRSLAVSEFSDAGWDLATAGESSSLRLGDAVLDLFEISKSPALAWGGAAFLVGFYLCAVALGAAGMSLMRAPEPAGGGSAASASAEEEEEEESRGVSVAIAVAPPARTHLPPPPPPPRLSLAVIDLSYFVPGSGSSSSSGSGSPGGKKKKDKEETSARRSEPRRLLDGVTASFEPGTLTALMGPSGAGKTTLLDVLAFRKTSGRVSFGGGNGNNGIGGGIFVGGARAEPRSFAAVSGYVEQSTEAHSPLLSVLESAVFSAQLRLPSSTTREAAGAAAQEALAVVGLGGDPRSSSSQLLVGSLPLEGRKRLAIAVELAAKPAILFLDEPTSGLDGRAAARVAAAMRAAADAGRTVVATIHQPSRVVFALFDSLLLLAPGGKVAFCGALGGGEEAPLLVEHFLSVLKEKEGPRAEENRAAWAMEVLSVPAVAEEEEEKEGSSSRPPQPRPRSAAAAAFPRSAAAADALAAARRASENGRGKGPSPPPLPGCLAHFAAHFLRNWRSYARDPARNTARFVVTAALALIVSTMETGKGRADRITSLKEVNNALGLLYLCAVVLSMDVAFEAQPFVAAERLVYYRERAAGAAMAGPQLLASAVVELPYLLAQTLLFAVPVYLAVGYERSAAAFGFFFLVLSLVNASMWLLAVALVQTTPAVFVASLCLSVACSLFSLLAGFMLPLPLFPRWWSWAWYANPVSYAIAAVAGSQYGARDDVLVEDAPANLPKQLGALLSATYGFGGREGAFPSQWESVGVLCGFCAVFAAGAYAGLNMNWQKR